MNVKKELHTSELVVEVPPYDVGSLHQGVSFDVWLMDEKVKAREAEMQSHEEVGNSLLKESVYCYFYYALLILEVEPR